MSSPNMNNIIIIGCFLVYTSIYILRINPQVVSSRVFEVFCIVRLPANRASLRQIDC